MGDTVSIMSHDGARLGAGAYSPHSQIAVRMWTFDPEVEVDENFMRDRLSRAIEARRGMVENGPLAAYRLVNAESDGLPGLVVDRYADFLVCQFASAGPERWRDTIVESLVDILHPVGIYERSDLDVRSKEQLPRRVGILVGEEPPELVPIEERGIRFLVDVRSGHKTGFYLDQRTNRARCADYAPGVDVLNCFSYTGGFGASALTAGAAHVTNVDSSADALALSERIFHENGLDTGQVEHVQGDVFSLLRRFRDARRSFDLIVLDPPKFAESRSQLDRAARGYKDINLMAFRLLRPGGTLLTFSCSGHMKPELFQKVVSDAALDAGRDARIVEHLFQAPDHPVSLTFPEAAYLKGFACRVL